MPEILVGIYPSEMLSKALDTAQDQLFEEQKQVPEEVAADREKNLPLDQVLPYSFASRRADALA